MANLIPRIIKDKISRELQYPIKYSDIEFCFLERKADADVYLNVYFWDHCARDMESRAKAIAKDKYPLVSMDSYPGYWGIAWAGPWKDVENPNVVTVRVEAVPREKIASSGMASTLLRGLLEEQVRMLNPQGIGVNRWRLDLSLLPEAGAIECLSKHWEGLREEHEKKVLIPIENRRKSVDKQ